MKKFLIMLLALTLLLTTSALADATLEKVTELEKSVTFCRYSGNYVLRTDEGYRLYDARGNVLSGVYKDIRVQEYGEYLIVQNVSSSTSINCVGLLDSMGREILPMAYGAIETYHGDGWVFAFVLSPSTSDVGEYSDSKGNKYIIARTDVVYNGQKIGSLDRADFQSSYNVYTRGPSVFIRISSEKGYWLTSTFERKDVTSDSFVNTSEYSEVYRGPVTHNPTQQQAFTASCTLTRDQVQQYVWYDSIKRQVLDLQGNVLLDDLTYDSVRVRGDYLEIESDSYRNSGVMSLDGQVIIPSKYKEIAYGVDSGSYFASGYTAALDESGNLYYFDQQGNMTASAEYGLTSSDYKGFIYNAPIVYVKNLGKYMIITATHGTLSKTYDEALTGSERQRVIAVRDGDNWGVIDMAGNTVVPFELRSSPSISYDGTLVYGETYARECRLYHISYDAEGAAAVQSAPEGAVAVQSGTDDAEPALAEGAWECSCGVITNGNFCPECGSKKPEPTPAPAADDGSWTCSCGATNTSKFCPECGSKKPEDPQCQNCGYKPEGDAPKFCPECGTKF